MALMYGTVYGTDGLGDSAYVWYLCPGCGACGRPQQVRAPRLLADVARASV